MANKTVKKIEATKPTLSAQYSTFTRKRKVAAYARVSTAKEEQENSFDAQVSYYTQKIQANPEWVFVEVYSDESAIIGLSQNPVQTGGDLALFFLFSAQFSANEGVPA